MDSGTLLKSVLSTKVVERGARGRPRLGWMDGVKRALRERGVNVTEAKECARNRNDWRVIVGQQSKGLRPNHKVTLMMPCGWGNGGDDK